MDHYFIDTSEWSMKSMYPLINYASSFDFFGTWSRAYILVILLGKIIPILPGSFLGFWYQFTWGLMSIIWSCESSSLKTHCITGYYPSIGMAFTNLTTSERLIINLEILISKTIWVTEILIPRRVNLNLGW